VNAFVGELMNSSSQALRISFITQTNLVTNLVIPAKQVGDLRELESRA